MLEKGTVAPDFTLLDQDGKEHTLSSYRGKKVILFFYSKDQTAGCTKQACGYRDVFPRFKEKDVVVFGISKDTVASHARFKLKYELPYDLLSDPETEVMNAYEVRVMKNMYGRKVMGTLRSSYLIDENGIIAEVKSKVKPDDNAEEMYKIL